MVTIRHRWRTGLLLALLWYGVIFLIVRTTRMEAGLGSAILTFPHSPLVLLVDFLGETWQGLGRLLFLPNSGAPAAWFALFLYIGFWWLTFGFLISRLRGAGDRCSDSTDSEEGKPTRPS